MFRDLPAPSKLLRKRWDKQTIDICQSKVRAVKPTIDISWPYTFGQRSNRAKKYQLQEDRYTEIERENRILLEKMTNILQHRRIKSHKTLRSRSLNKSQRQRKLNEITEANAAMLKRIKDQESSYDFGQMDKDRKVSQNRLKYLCEFPYKLGQRSRSPVNLFKSQSRRYSEKPRRSKTITPTKKETILKEKKILNGIPFTITISKTKKKIIMKVSSQQSQDKADLEIKFVEAVEICGGTTDFSKLLEMLVVENGQFVLDVENADDD